VGENVIAALIKDGHLLTDVKCNTWEELVDIAGKPLVDAGLIQPGYLDAVKGGVEKYGAYMVLVDDVAFFHARPEDGANALCLSLAMLAKPVYILEKRVKAAFVFAAVDKVGHVGLLRELAQLLRDDEFLHILCESGDGDAVMNRLKGV